MHIVRIGAEATELRPAILDMLGLVSALEWQAHDFQSRTGITCQFNSSIEELNLDTEPTTVVFRIFQEALTNILRHAQATRVEVSPRWASDADAGFHRAPPPRGRARARARGREDATA